MMKYLKYIMYLIKHKWFVGIECFKRGLIWRGIVHDVSKLLPSEFFAYANYFYGKPLCSSLRELKRKEKFNRAWLRHQHRNKHHWQHWVLVKDSDETIVIPMPRKYVYEMIADWIGAGRAIKGRGIPKDEVVDWYLRNRPNMILHPETEDKIVQILSKKFRLEAVSLLQGVKRRKPTAPKPWPEESKYKVGGIVDVNVPDEFTGKPYPLDGTGKPYPPDGVDLAKGSDRTAVVTRDSEGKIIEAEIIVVSSKNQSRTKV